MGYRYGPYLSAYLPDNECDPWLSPRNWARGMSYAISAGVTAKGIWSGYKVWKGGREKLEFIVNMNKQRKHIHGTNENKTANAGKEIKRSLINPNLDVQKLVNKYAGTGTQIGPITKGSPGSKERIITNQVIGRYYNTDTKRFEETTNFIIHYAKNDVHIVPAGPK